MSESRPVLMEAASLFDIHTHLLGNARQDEEFLAFAERWRMPFAASCLGPEGRMLANPTLDECRRANDLVLRLMEHKPDLAHGFCYVSQEHGQQAVEELRRCVEHGMRGVKLWVAVKCNDERTYPIAEEAASLDVPILQHSYLRRQEVLPGESKPVEIASLARRYPGLRVIMAHIAFRWREGVDSVRECPNILVDTSGFDPELGSIEYAVSRLGSKRVLFGTDAPGRDALCQIGKVMAAGITAEERENVLRLNSMRLLKCGGVA